MIRTLAATPFVLTLSILLLLAPAHAREDRVPLDTDRYMQLLSVSLALSDAQADRIRPVIDTHFDAIREVQRKIDAGHMKRLQAAAALRSARVERDEAVLPLLDDEQKTAWEELQKKLRAEMRKRFRQASGR